MSTNKEKNKDMHRLKRVLGRTDVLTLAFGTMVGWGWVMLSGQWIMEAGILGSLIAFAAGAVLCILVGLTYAELTAALPLAGGEMVFAYRAIGGRFAWLVGWAISLVYIGVAAWEGIAIATAIDYILPLPKVGFLWSIGGYPVFISWSILGMAGALVLVFLNYFGIRPAAIFQVMVTSAMFLVGLIFALGGISFGRPEFVSPVFTGGKGILVVLLIVPSMFVGFDVIPQSAEEMNLPLGQISKMFMISIIMAATWYFMVIIGMGFSAPPEVRNGGIVPAADAMAYCYGSPLFGKIMILGGICGIMTSWNGFMVGSTRIIYAMGRAKMLPPFFAKLHPKHKTPVGAIIFVGAICTLAPLLGKNALIWFVNASAFGSVLSYLMVAVAFLVLRKKEPDLNRPFKVKYGRTVGIFVVVVSLVFLSLYIPRGLMDYVWTSEWIMIVVWILLGVILMIWNSLSYGVISSKDRELLIFGEEYSRKVYLNE